VIGYQDGRWLPQAQIAVSIEDPGLLVGDGVFESVRLHRRALYRLDAHLERLEGSAQVLRIELPPRDELAGVLRDLCRRNDVAEAAARLLVTRGARGRPSIMATLRPVSKDWEARAARGWRLVTARTRHPDPETLPPALKSLGRVHSVLARMEAADAGVDDALLLAHDGAVAEGPTWNFFFRLDGGWCTASVDVGVLPGVTRTSLVDVMTAAGERAEAGRWPAARLLDADAAFATMSSMGAVPVVALDGRELPASREATAPLQQAYWQQVRAEAQPVDD